MCALKSQTTSIIFSFVIGQKIAKNYQMDASATFLEAKFLGRILRRGLRLVTRLWRVPATLPYPDFIFTTRTLPEKFWKFQGSG